MTTLQRSGAATLHAAPEDNVDPALVLLRPYRLSGALTLKNRILMAPLTRSMATDDLVPTEDMAEYYARRAGAGLIVSEATLVRADGQGYPNTPGLWSEEQVRGWSHVTRRIHDRGGKIFAQLWHTGRVSHPIYQGGAEPVAPSAVPLTGRVPRTDNLQYGTPRALEVAEIGELVQSFARAAANAIRAGFDGVEIHGANGYLLDQFLHHDTNRRMDAYGGDPEAMIRFVLEVTDATTALVGSGRTGIRLSPGAYVNVEGDPRDADVFLRLLEELDRRDLAYVHVGIFDDETEFPDLRGTASAFLRRHYGGTLVGNGGYTPAKAALALGAGKFDLVSIGRPFIANPDLVERLERREPLSAYRESMLGSLV